ncbi:hypothetical protein BJV77DRAFT_1002917 [Russula vinacea]|nr:hypothetical protein BJV77DRAFT_1002917 [Russula vinacea]
MHETSRPPDSRTILFYYSKQNSASRRFIFIPLALEALHPLLSVVPVMRETSYQNKRMCPNNDCKSKMPAAVDTWTPSPASQTVSTPTLANSTQVGSDPGRGTGSVLEPSPALPSTKNSATASHGTVLYMGLTSLLATVLAF